MGDEQNPFLPIANMGRIMKQILPPSAKVSKEAKETMQECVTEFISFVTSEASDKCRKGSRKTICGDDICWALGAVGLDNYAQAMVRYLHKYRVAALNQQKATTSSFEDKDEESDRSGEPSHQEDETTTPQVVMNIFI
ncbi:hypothetical protein ES319_D11G301900v1 [Gossypium barbadense]|uniref:Transcription factor CBF/NF-Y/archaeal histone domain-containing protein n=2 Tax=Gossypium TaxID=3633 RepID=A0A5J5PK83_GOSBA|nr:hypothetical protein ES319_D11G301900v1 [Gossypium barbadense]PPD86100.1 hypothetical protein GOBAR_DD16970 [Gossypium barbadense]TYG47206.1 hypothetical protein ES288_D11G319700v1 [Gossypium darwinii]